MQLGTILAVVQQDLQLISRLRAFVAQNCGAVLQIARSSEEAILYLRGVGVYSDRVRYPLPYLIVLDPENEDSSDLEVLSWLREHTEFSRTAVAILSSQMQPPYHMLCALDQFSYIIHRQTLNGLPEAICQSVFRQSVEPDKAERKDNARVRGKIPKGLPIESVRMLRLFGYRPLG
jgi:hypothetical protein